MDQGSVSQKRFRSTSQWAIHLTRGIYDGTVLGNTGSIGTGSGIFVGGGRDSAIKGNTLEDGSGTGLHVQLESETAHGSSEAAKHTIVGNTFTNWGDDGMLLEGATLCTATGNICGQNSQAASGTYSGFA